MAGVVGWAGVSEYQAENDARAFCNSVSVGERFAPLVERARAVGDDQLRIVRETSVIVGFMGIPPFSRHACEVTSTNDVVDGKRYIHID